MNRREKAEDIAALVLGAPLFGLVAAVTGAVMAVGFVAMTVYERVAKPEG